MEKRMISRLRNSVTVGFAFLSMLLVLGIWSGHLLSPDPGQPGHVRSTLTISNSPGIDLTLTARPAKGPGEGEGGGVGSGGGQGDEHDIVVTPSPSPTFDFGNWATEDISDDLADI